MRASVVVAQRVSLPKTCGIFLIWIKPMFPALAGKLLTSGPPWKFLDILLVVRRKQCAHKVGSSWWSTWPELPALRTRGKGKSCWSTLATSGLFGIFVLQERRGKLSRKHASVLSWPSVIPDIQPSSSMVYPPPKEGSMRRSQEGNESQRNKAWYGTNIKRRFSVLGSVSGSRDQGKHGFQKAGKKQAAVLEQIESWPIISLQNP